MAATERLALFQFMVGNADWSIERQDNIVLLGMPDGRQVPVLFDLDLSGLVNPHYARPPEGVPVGSVTERYFLGYCHRDADWDALFDQFAALRPDVGKLLAATPGLGRGDRRMAGVYLDSFFAILDSPERRTRDIVNACREWPGSRSGA